jgi:acyl-CoA synthetase (AMP-forming)/AMP-acid ligase II
MSVVRPVWDHVRTQARLRPDALAVWGPAGPIAYHALVRDVDVVATRLLEEGLSHDDMVGLHYGFSYLHLLLILALDRLSIPSMSFATGDPSTPPVIAPAFALTAVISALAAPSAVACRWIRLDAPDRALAGTPDAGRLATLDSPPEAPVRVAWSSGTTGGAKGVPITRAVQAERVTARRLLRGIGPKARYFPGMPFSAATTYGTLLAVLAAGGSVVFPSPAAHFIDLANALGVTVTNAPPALLAELVESAGALRRLETIQIFEVPGAQLPSALAQRARTQLTPNIAVTYGATEAARIATADAALVVADPTAVGYVTPGVTVEVVDIDDQPVAAGREGMVRIRSGQTVAGYLNDPDATARNFRDGWFYPGDVGVQGVDGLLRLVGRIEEMIPDGGALVSPGPLEDGLRRVPGVRDVAVFTLPEADGVATVCAALVLAPGIEPEAVRADAAARLGDRAPARLVVVDQLPRTPTGKVQRRVLAETARRETVS